MYFTREKAIISYVTCMQPVPQRYTVKPSLAKATQTSADCCFSTSTAINSSRSAQLPPDSVPLETCVPRDYSGSNVDGSRSGVRCRGAVRENADVREEVYPACPSGSLMSVFSHLPSLSVLNLAIFFPFPFAVYLVLLPHFFYIYTYFNNTTSAGRHQAVYEKPSVLQTAASEWRRIPAVSSV